LNRLLKAILEDPVNRQHQTNTKARSNQQPIGYADANTKSQTWDSEMKYETEVMLFCHAIKAFSTGVLHLIRINHQPDATIFQFIILNFFTAQNVSGVFPPIIRSSMNAVAASGFTFVSW
jgi:hypothetical protein